MLLTRTDFLGQLGQAATMMGTFLSLVCSVYAEKKWEGEEAEQEKRKAFLFLGGKKRVRTVVDES